MDHMGCANPQLMSRRDAHPEGTKGTAVSHDSKIAGEGPGHGCCRDPQLGLFAALTHGTPQAAVRARLLPHHLGEQRLEGPLRLLVFFRTPFTPPQLRRGRTRGREPAEAESAPNRLQTSRFFLRCKRVRSLSSNTIQKRRTNDGAQLLERRFRACECFVPLRPALLQRRTAALYNAVCIPSSAHPKTASFVAGPSRLHEVPSDTALACHEHMSFRKAINSKPKK